MDTRLKPLCNMPAGEKVHVSVSAVLPWFNRPFAGPVAAYPCSEACQCRRVMRLMVLMIAKKARPSKAASTMAA